MSQRDLSTMFFLFFVLFLGGRVVYNHVGDSIQPCGGGVGGSMLPVGKVATEEACGYLRHIAILLIKK